MENVSPQGLEPWSQRLEHRSTFGISWPTLVLRRDDELAEGGEACSRRNIQISRSFLHSPNGVAMSG
jgi:hypothetical protein